MNSISTFQSLILATSISINCQTQKESLLMQNEMQNEMQDATQDELQDEMSQKPIEQQAFELASKIDFYYYHKQRSNNRVLIKEGAPLCEANAMVYADQIQKEFNVPVKIVQINLNTSSYQNYCAYPQTYAWHTVATLEGEDGIQYVIDPFSQNQATALDVFISDYVKKDCINFTLDQLEEVAKLANGTAITTGADNFRDFLASQKEAYKNNILTPVPIVNYDYKWTFEELDSLATNTFIYINETDLASYEKVNHIIFSLEPADIPKDKWARAYSWVRPKSTEIDSPIWANDIQDTKLEELVTRETFE